MVVRRGESIDQRRQHAADLRQHQRSHYSIFTYRRSDAANTSPNTTIAVHYGSGLSGWSTAVPGPEIIITPTDDFYGASPGVDKVEVKIKRALAVDNKLFTRLKIEVAP